MNKLLFGAGLSTVAILTACGGSGGGDEGSSQTPTSMYQVFTGNTNNEVIFDGGQTRFAVRKSDRNLVFFSNGQALNGLTVSENGDVLRVGVKIGAVILDIGRKIETGQNDPKVAQLACSGPAPSFGAMSILVTNNLWTYRCASDIGIPAPALINPSSNTVSGNVNSGNNPALVRSNCVSLERQSTIGWQIRNSCQEEVTVAFCYVNPDDKSSASRLLKCSSEGYGSSLTIRAGAVESIPSPGNSTAGYSYRYVACARNNERESIPRLSNQGNSAACL